MCFLKAGVILSLSVLFVAARIIELPNGKLQGAAVKNYYSFTNIPYAETPKRFEPSIPLESTWTGIRNATGDVVSCVQFGVRTNASEGQEDCLILSVYTPNTATNENLLPVFVFIHGGAFMFGSSSFYSPETILEQEKMVVVSLNYRVGAFGFLTTGDGIIQGNLGLKDQLLALRWIKQNILLFGGNPEKILLVGNSAGGASVHLHALRKETENLVSAAASLSGTAFNPWAMQRNAKAISETLANTLKCPPKGPELKACLQEQSIEKIHAAVLELQTYRGSPLTVFAPVIESAEIPGTFITEDPRSLVAKGEIANIPWMATFTTEEGAYNAAALMEKNETGVEFIEELNKRWFELAPILLLYYDDPSEQSKQKRSLSLREKYMGNKTFSRDTYPLFQKMFSDVLFINDIRETIEEHRKFGQNPVWGYVYGNPHNYGVGNFFANDMDYQFGAAHGDDEQLIMPLTLDSSYKAGIYDEKIARNLIDMFESFVVKGTPLFGHVALPKNGNSHDLMQYLQILQQYYCVGPWESFSYSNHQCQECACYDYTTDKMEQ